MRAYLCSKIPKLLNTVCDETASRDILSVPRHVPHTRKLPPTEAEREPNTHRFGAAEGCASSERAADFPPPPPAGAGARERSHEREVPMLPQCHLVALRRGRRRLPWSPSSPSQRPALRSGRQVPLIRVLMRFIKLNINFVTMRYVNLRERSLLHSAKVCTSAFSRKDPFSSHGSK